MSLTDQRAGPFVYTRFIKPFFPIVFIQLYTTSNPLYVKPYTQYTRCVVILPSLNPFPQIEPELLF